MGQLQIVQYNRAGRTDNLESLWPARRLETVAGTPASASAIPLQLSRFLHNLSERSRAKARLLTETSPCHIYVHLEVASFRLPVESKLLTPRQTRPTYPWPP